MKKKLSVILLSLVMIATMMPLSVFADTANTNNKEITTEKVNSDATAEETDSDATAEETESEEVDPSTDYLSFTAVDADMTLGMSKMGRAPEVTYEYSADRDVWIDFIPGETTVDIAKDKTIYFRAKEDGQNFPGSSSGFLTFVMSEDGKINADGNIMSLVSQDCSETKMQANGFSGLFWGCAPLATAPKLPATEMASRCYFSMFHNCKNLVKAPNLPAKSLASGCYDGVFSGCSKLNSVSVGFKNWNDATSDWLVQVAPKGTFTCPEELDTSIKDVSHVPEGWTIEHPQTDYLSFTAADANMTISMIKKGDAPNVTYEYSSDKSSWIDFIPETTSIDIPKDTTIYFRAKEDGQSFPSKGFGESLSFVMSGSGEINADGNIMSLVSKDCSETEMDVSGFDGLFMNCTCLTTPPKLLATKLAKSCYAQMFDGCSRLEEPPELPATTMEAGCYSNMFNACTNLQKAPTLPATELAKYCYQYMFVNCSNLANAPDLPAMELEEGCYVGMFKGCINLTKISKLPAKTLAQYCYSDMFAGCSKLNNVSVGFKDWFVDGEGYFATNKWLDGVAVDGTFTCPEELDMSIRDASHVPVDWTVEHPQIDYLSFTAVDADMSIGMNAEPGAPEVRYEYSSDKGLWIDFTPGTTTVDIAKDQTIYFRAKEDSQDFPGGMLTFIMSGAGKINAGGNIMSLVSKDCSEIKMKRLAFSRLFHNCMLLAKAPKLPAMELEEECYSFMFAGCGFLTEAPELPATSLAPYCYFRMFADSAALKTAPDLPADTLTPYCYSQMFTGCGHLNSISVEFKEWNESNHATDNWLDHAAEKGTFTCPEELDTSIKDVSHVPVGWTVKHPIPPDYLSFTAVDADMTISMAIEEGAPDVTYKYSSDKSSWTDFIPGTTTVDITEDETIYFRAKDGTQDFPGKEGSPLQFIMEGKGKINAGGNIMSLVSKDCSETEMQGYGFSCLFYNCASLATPPKLPATKLAECCYAGMFDGCSNLIDAPELPAMEMKHQCYRQMFSDCTSLTKAPELPAETLVDGCYSEMFIFCSKLNSVSVGFKEWDGSNRATDFWLDGVAADGTFACPEELDTSIKDASHVPKGWTIEHPRTDYLSFSAVDADMTISMAKVGDAPNVTYEYSSDRDSWIDFIPGTTTINITKDQTIYFRAKEERQDFPGRFGANLKFVMSGEGKINAGGNIMSLVSQDCTETEMDAFGFTALFTNCACLATPPKLPATKLATECYSYMFYHCSNLTEAAELPAATLATNCYRCMFSGCSSLTEAPDLPALKLEKDCYNNMFAECTNLKKAPNLPAETLASDCYYKMFAHCSKLNSVSVGFKDWIVDDEGENSTATDGWLDNVATEGTFACPEELDTSIKDASHVPADWTVVGPTPPEPPVIPTMKSLKAKAIDSKTCQLNWEELTQFDNVKYEIYRGTSETRHWPKIDEVTGNSYIDTNVKAGTKYYYMLSPVVTVGGKEYYGPYSNIDYGYPRINALTGFRVWASDYETANISWNKCLDKDAEFWIYRGTKPTGDWGSVYAKVTENEATSWSETLTPGSKYYYMVREAVKGNDGKYYFGPYTKVDYAYPRLNAPSGFSAWASDKTTCKCSWNKLPGDGIQYLVYRGNAPTGNWGPAIGSTTDGSYTDKGRTTGHKYYYMVRAKVTVNGKTYFGPYTKVDYGYPR